MVHGSFSLVLVIDSSIPLAYWPRGLCNQSLEQTQWQVNTYVMIYPIRYRYRRYSMVQYAYPSG